MGFHYGYEKRKFDAEWTRLEQEYRAAGMDDRQIAAMKEYDWTWFCSQRTYQNRVQALPSEQCEDESEQSCLFRKFESLSCTWDTGDVDSRRFGWLSSLENELLYRRLCKLRRTTWSCRPCSLWTDTGRPMSQGCGTVPGAQSHSE